MAFWRPKHAVHLLRQTPTPTGSTPDGDGVESPSPQVPSSADSPVTAPVDEGNAGSTTQVGETSAPVDSGVTTPPTVTVRQEPTAAPPDGVTSDTPDGSSPPPSEPPSSNPQPPPTSPPASPPSSPPPSQPPSSDPPPPSPPPSSDPPPPSSSPPPTSPPSSDPTPPPTSPPSSDPPSSSSDSPPPPSSTSSDSSSPPNVETTPPPTTSSDIRSSTPTSYTTTEIVTSIDGQLTTITTQTPLPTSLWSPSSSPSRGPATSVIAGVSVGAAILFLILIGGIYAYRRHRRNRAVFGFVERLVARHKHQQGRARLLQGEEFDDEENDVAMTPYRDRDRDGAHSRGSSVGGMTPLSVHSRGMSSANAFGVLDPQNGRGTPNSLASEAPVGSGGGGGGSASPGPSLFRARANESGSIFREEGVWPPPGEESRLVDPFVKGMGAGEGLLGGSSSMEYTGVPGAGMIATSSSSAPSISPPQSPTPAVLTIANPETPPPPPAYRPSPLSASTSNTPTITSTQLPGTTPSSTVGPSLSALISATETPMKMSLSSTLSLPQASSPSPPSSPPASVLGTSGLPPGAAPPRPPSALAVTSSGFDAEDMVLPVVSGTGGSASSSPSGSPILGGNLRSEKRMSRMSFGGGGEGSPKNWLERSVHPKS